jgi:hypothetical protein
VLAAKDASREMIKAVTGLCGSLNPLEAETEKKK